jgi:hypothetical protein
MPIPTAAQSMVWVYDRPLAGIAGSNLAECAEVYLMNVVWCAVTSVCDGPIACPEQSYRVCVCVRVIKCDQVQH